MTESMDARISRLHAQGLVDMHFDLLMNLYEKRQRTGVLAQDFESDLAAGDISVLGTAIFIEEAYLPEQALRVGLDQVARLYIECERSPRFVICRTSAELDAARATGRIALLITMEGVEPIGTDLNLLRVFYELGLRMVGLTHARRNLAADGGLLAANTSSRHGLPPFGRELVTEAERLGMIVDLAHLNPAGVDDVLAMTKHPPVISHTNPRAFFDIDRNTSDDQLRAVGARGGVIGVNGALVGSTPEQATLDTYVDNIEHIVRVAGINAVGLGFDFFKFIWDSWSPATRAGFIAYFREPTFMPELSNHSQTRALTRCLVERGWSAPDIASLLYGNWLRVLHQLL